jgi:hypothetical protein
MCICYRNLVFCFFSFFRGVLYSDESLREKLLAGTAVKNLKILKIKN